MYFQVHKIFMANKVWPENAMLQCLHLECVTKKNQCGIVCAENSSASNIYI